MAEDSRGVTVKKPLARRTSRRRTVSYLGCATSSSGFGPSSPILGPSFALTDGGRSSTQRPDLGPFGLRLTAPDRAGFVHI